MKQEVGVLVGTQMGFCVVGVFLNNVAFITLKELPSMRASTYNILLCHIVLGTLLYCCCLLQTGGTRYLQNVIQIPNLPNTTNAINSTYLFLYPHSFTAGPPD